MSFISNEQSVSRQTKRPKSNDKLLSQKLQSLTQNIKKVTQTKQILQQSFQESQYTYSELQRMYNSLFNKYKSSMNKIDMLEQQITQQIHIKQELSKQNEQLLSYFSDNGLNLSDIQQSIVALKDIRGKYENQKGNLLREQQINKELIKIVEECLEKVESGAEYRRMMTEGRYIRDDDNEEWDFMDRVRGFLEFICNDREELMTFTKRSQKGYPQNDSVKEIPSLPEEYKFQLIDPKQLLLPQLRENTQKDQEAYMRQKIKNPYVSELLEKISERSKEEASDRSIMISSKRKSLKEFGWQDSSDVRQYDVSDIKSDVKSQNKSEDFVRKSSQISTLKAEKSHMHSSVNHNPTPEHLYETLMSIEKKFVQLEESSAQELNQSKKEKYQMTQQMNQLEEIVIRLKEDILQMESQIHQKGCKIAKLASQLQEAQIKIEQIQQQRNKKDQEIEEINEELELEKDISKQQKADIEEKERILSEKLDLVTKLQREIKILKSQNSQLSNQVDRLTQSYQSTEAKESQIIKIWTAKVQSWKRVALNNQGTSKQFETEISLLKSEIQKKKSEQLSKQRSITETTKANKELTEDLIKMKNMHVSLEEKNKILVQQMKRYKEENSILTQKNRTLNQMKQQLQTLVKKSNQRVRNLVEQNQIMIQQKNSLRNETDKSRKSSQKSKYQSQRNSKGNSSGFSESGDSSFYSIGMSREDDVQEIGMCEYGETKDQVVKVPSYRQSSSLIQYKEAIIQQLESEMVIMAKQKQYLSQKLQKSLSQIQRLNQLLYQYNRNTNNNFDNKSTSQHQYQHQIFHLQSTFSTYKHQKQAQIQQLQQIITKKIQLFQNKLVQEQNNYQQQILKLSRFVQQLENQNQSLKREIGRIREVAGVEKEKNLLLQSEVKKLSAKIDGTIQSKDQQGLSRPLLRENHPIDSSVKDQQTSHLLKQAHQQKLELSQKLFHLESILLSRDQQIQSLALTLQKLKNQLQKAAFSYETQVQAIQAGKFQQLKEKQIIIKDIQNHYEHQIQAMRDEYEKELSSMQNHCQTQQRLHEAQQSSYTSAIQQLKQRHTQQINAIYASAQEKINSLKQLNKKAKSKLIQQEEKIKTHEYNMGEFTHLLNQKDIVVQDLTQKLHQKDEEIQKLLRNSFKSKEMNHIEKTYGQLEIELNRKIEILQQELILEQQKHSKGQSSLAKVIDQLRNENILLKKQNQDITKALQRQSKLNKEKLKYIMQECKKEKLKIHTLALSWKYTPQVNWGSRIQAQISSPDSSINLMMNDNNTANRQKYFKVQRTDSNELQEREEQKRNNLVNPRNQSVNAIKPTDSVQFRPRKKQPQNSLNQYKNFTEFLPRHQEEQFFEPILIGSTQNTFEYLAKGVSTNGQRRSHNLAQRQAPFKSLARNDFFLLNDFGQEPKNPYPLSLNQNRIAKNTSKESIPQKDVDDQCFHDFIMMDKKHSKESFHSVIQQDYTNEPFRLKRTPSSQIAIHPSGQNFTPILTANNNRRSSMNSLHSTPEYTITSPTYKSQFGQLNQMRQSQEMSSKRSMEMRMLEETIRRKKEENQLLLREIKERGSKN